MMNKKPKNPIQTPKHISKKSDTIVITDKAIEENFPTEEEKEVENKPFTIAEVEEAIGGDIPVEDVINMNKEDEELDKETDII